MQEIWRDIVDYEGKYQVSNYGTHKENSNNPLTKEHFHRKEKF